MTLQYGNFPYFLFIFLSFGFTAGLFFLLRKRKPLTQKIVIAVLLFLNFFQHIFKLYIYPQYENGFSYENSAYTLCALFILLAPFVFLSKSKLLKDALFWFGTTAAIAAICIPYAAVAQEQEAFSWESLRYYLCHTLLLCGSLLPVLLGLHKINYKNAWKFPFLFYLAQICVLVNDAILISAGYLNLDNWGTDNLYRGLYHMNPGWTMRPNELFGPVNEIVQALSPSVFYVNAAGEEFTWPILWSAVPLFFAITIATFLIGILIDFKNFKSDLIFLKGKIIALKEKIVRFIEKQKQKKTSS